MLKEHTAAMKKHSHAQHIRNAAIVKRAADIVALRVQIASADATQGPKLSKRLAKLEDNPLAPGPPPPTPRMQAEEVRLLLQLSTALKILLAPATTAQERERGSSLLYDYLIGYKQVWPAVMRISPSLNNF